MEIPSRDVITQSHTSISKGFKKENKSVSCSFPFLYRMLIPVMKINLVVLLAIISIIKQNKRD